ncbi:3-dehydroquinate synthase [Candidatus Syntrophocurvum alkaliphilum]|uniref:3-dehydroquinate synthase n=1 Tax=Candidatus Syntrophocurvum alkaliphilum TaxID=2293317 RepID=A0A6I6DDQ2_9FIRM|nr:3-dehydroquinate synthase [Candidatus Syntrophocurvum alkaliphilum]QGT98932.1 3-dehydroquinate synthase [Candidatus Syntrophocurvum alkaliphilum]
MHKVNVNLGDKSYNIYIDKGLLANTAQIISEVSSTKKILLVSNPTVYSLYGEVVIKELRKANFEVIKSIIPDGEQYKNMKEALKVIDLAIKNNLERSSIIVALGGGVVGDLAGFVASIYHRGIDFVQIPTTLLAQVDSSVGGKVAVNHPEGKNIIGAFHQPKAVIIDTNTLKTLEKRDYKSGLAEITKYGIIFDKEFFTFIENNLDKIKSMKDLFAIEELISKSCIIKRSIVELDEKEYGIRAILNLGHTFGHSIEKLTDYTTYRHGEAVALGILYASELAADYGSIKTSEKHKIQNLLVNLELLTKLPMLTGEQIYNGMLNDKKMENNKLNLVLPKGIGDYIITADIPENEIIQAINKVNENF